MPDDRRALIEWARGAYRPYEVQRLISSLADALEKEIEGESMNELARQALETIRIATNLALPSEQTIPDWDRCVRVPVANMAAIDAALASVLGEPPITGDPKPAFHPPHPGGHPNE